MGKFLFETLFQDFYDAFLFNNQYLDYFKGIWVTIKISFFAVILGVLLGTIVAIIKHFAKEYKSLKPAEWICNIYVSVIRGTPVYLQFALAGLAIFTSRSFPIEVVGIITFGVNSGAYVSEIIRGGINSIDKGQTEAGRSLGLSPGKTMRLIILPQAIKNILPALGNEFISLIKETAIVGILGATDIMKVAINVGNRTYKVFPPLIIAAIYYLIIVLGLTKLMGILERRLAKSDTH